MYCRNRLNFKVGRLEAGGGEGGEGSIFLKPWWQWEGRKSGVSELPGWGRAVMGLAN